MPRIRQYAERDAMKDSLGEINAHRSIKKKGENHEKSENDA